MYITDSIYYHGQNKCITMRYADVIDTNRKVDERTADEIALDVIKNCGLVVKE